MGNKRNVVRRRRRIRSKAGKAGKSKTGSSPSGVRRYRAVRNFSFYPSSVDSAGRHKDSWLDKLVAYGSIAMKIATLLLSESDVGATAAVTGCVQTVAIGVEDILATSGIKRSETFMMTVDDKKAIHQYKNPLVGYRQALLQNLTIKICSGAEQSRRGGRVVVVVVPLTIGESSDYLRGASTDRRITPTFVDLLRMPGARTFPASSRISINWSPSSGSWTGQWQELGQLELPTSIDNPPNGGRPLCLVHVGYQDMASAKSDPSTLYSADEALLHVDLHMTCSLRELGNSWIRGYPVQVQNASRVSVSGPGVPDGFDVSKDSLIVKDGELHMKREHLPSSVLHGLSIPQWITCTPVSVPVKWEAEDSIDRAFEQVDIDCASMSD